MRLRRSPRLACLRRGRAAWICHRIELVSYVLEAETVKGQSMFTQNVGGPVFDRGGQGLNR